MSSGDKKDFEVNAPDGTLFLGCPHCGSDVLVPFAQMDHKSSAVVIKGVVCVECGAQAELFFPSMMKAFGAGHITTDEEKAGMN